MLPLNMQHILPLLAAFTVCQVPIKFRADTKLAKNGLHAYNAAAYNFNVEACFSASIILEYMFWCSVFLDKQNQSTVLWRILDFL